MTKKMTILPFYLLLLLIAFFLLFQFRTSDYRSQVYLIAEYTILAAALIIMWLLFSEVKKMTTEITALRIKAYKLENYIGSSNLLTRSEFANRIKFISMGTQRGIRLSNLISKKHCSLYTVKANPFLSI